MSEPEDFVVCRICGKEFQRITHAHLKTHDITFEEYQSEFPRTPTASEKSRKKMSTTMTGRTHTKEFKIMLSARMTGKNNPSKQPETKAKMRASSAERWKDPKNRAKTGTSMTELWKDPEYRASKTGKNNPMYGRTGENHPKWKGGSSFLPYCHLFSNNLKERVRNREGRICVLTDLMRSTLGPDAGLDDFEGHEIFNERRLSVHHIYGNKMAGCDGTELALIPLQRSFNSKKFDGLKLEDHPFYITLFMLKDMERKDREQRINGD